MTRLRSTGQQPLGPGADCESSIRTLEFFRATLKDSTVGEGYTSGVLLLKITVVLSSLRAEGTPRLVLAMCEQWRKRGVIPIILTLFSEPPDLAADFRAADIEVICLRWRPRGWSRYLNLAYAVAVLCREREVTGVISMPLGWHAFVAIGAWASGVPTVAHAGNAPSAAWTRSWILFWIEVQLGRPFTRKIICCSEYVLRCVSRAFWLRPAETISIPNGIDPTAWEAPNVMESKSSIFRIVMVGTLEKHKDQATLIDAMPQIISGARAAGREAQLVLVGDGTLRQSLEGLVQEQSISSAVTFVGSATNINEFLHSAHLFVFSTTAQEGQGIALLEAMAAGLPVVASDVGACREVLDNGACGLLVPPKDVSALANAVLSILDCPDHAREMVARAKQRVRKNYDVQVTASRYLSAIDSRQLY